MSWEIENYLEIKNNQLSIEGVSAVELAEKFGTPLFVFSESRIRHNIARLHEVQNVIDCKLKVCYAAKANSNMAILRAVKEAGSDLEVNSGGELFKAIEIGFQPEQIIFNGTSKTEQELEEAIVWGIYAIQCDSLYELELIEKVSRQVGKRAKVSLRIVPEIETATHPGLKTAMNSSKFGMTFDDALMAFKRWNYDDEHVNICGLHLHIGSQTPNEEPYTTALMFLVEKLREVAKTTGHQLSHLNLGGGFPVNYLRDNSLADAMNEENAELFASDFTPASALNAAWKAISEDDNTDLKNLTLLLEPGRSVIADAGVCLTTVRNKKARKWSVVSGQWSEENKESDHRPPAADHWLLTDAGFNILLSMETYKWYYHLISAQRANEAHETAYKVAGPLCDGGDVYFDIEGHGRLPDYRLLPENVEPNEVLALLNCGAYSIAQMFQYNARQLPAVVLIKENGEVELVRRRDSYQDLLGNDIW
ncbi:MAG TPA: diaminopimelate decarboxylase [Pyrinomonadaceae bacterium]|nr:diaminopimelate decarboxylase [Pyrinomonadaceae bacterium]